MIKTSKIMLGDLVRLTSGQIAKVVALDYTGDMVVEFVTEHNFRHHVSAREEDIEPIPLTKEFLLNNGFVLDCFDEYVHYYRLTGVENENGWIDIDSYDDGNSFYATLTCSNVKLEYVHQLQHILRQCGLNNDLKLPTK